MNTSAMLEDLGHSVIEATSGEEALEVLRREARIDLVITDQAMPRMTGTQLIAAIRAEWPGLAVILATSYAGPHKPFSQQALASAIARCSEDRTIGGC